MLVQRALQRNGRSIPGSVSPPLSGGYPFGREDLTTCSSIEENGPRKGSLEDFCNDYDLGPSSSCENCGRDEDGTGNSEKDEKCHDCECIISGSDVSGKVHSVNVRVGDKTVAMSGLQLRSVDLSNLHSPFADTIEEVSFAANHLGVFCLKWLSECTALERISLNGNNLKHLDWEALSNFPVLERLWLHRNELETADLAPLASCRALKSLYLDSNMINKETIDMSPLKGCSQLRSIRLGGNKLGGSLDITPLLELRSLRMFDVDSVVSLTSFESVESSKAFRKRAHKIKVTSKGSESNNVVKHEHGGVCRSPPTEHDLGKTDVSSPQSETCNQGVEPLDLSKVRPAAESDSFQQSPVSSEDEDYTPNDSVPSSCAISSQQDTGKSQEADEPIRILLIGFRRLARYAVEDSLARTAKVLMRAVDHSIMVEDPMSVRETHLILLQNPSEDTINQIIGIAPSTPIVIICSERYRTQAVESNSQHKATVHLYCTPLRPSEADAVIELGRMQRKKQRLESVSKTEQFAIPNEGKSEQHSGKLALQRAVRRISSERSGNRKRCTFHDLVEKIRSLRRRGDERVSSQLMRTEKIQAERAAVELSFKDLGGEGTAASFSGIARTCGLPKCAGSVLFEASLAAMNNMEATTPESGVPLFGKNEEAAGNLKWGRNKSEKTLKLEEFLPYWNKIKTLEPEARLIEILRDSSVQKSSPRSSMDLKASPPRSPRQSLSGRRQPSVCIKKLVARYMDDRKQRMGTFSLVKVPESITIATSLLTLVLHSGLRNPSQEVSERDLERSQLNATFVAAESGKFEGLAGMLSLDRIREIKRSFAAESSAYRANSRNGSTIGYNLTEGEVVKFCRKSGTLTAPAVHAVLRTYCGRKMEMSVGKFAQLYVCLTDLTEEWAANYFFSVVDVDMDNHISVGDLKGFHMENDTPRNTECGPDSCSSPQSIWWAFCDLAQPAAGAAVGISRKDFLNHTPEERETMIQTALFIDEESALPMP